MEFNLNKRQLFYYKRAILGLSFYGAEQVKFMGFEKRNRIIKVHNKTKKVLFTLRYSKVVELSNDVLGKFFCKGLLYNEFLNENPIFNDVYFPIELTDEELGITLQDKVIALVESGALGPNFLNMK